MFRRFSSRKCFTRRNNSEPVIFRGSMFESSARPILDSGNVFRMPSEDELHEGTWLQWPHNYGWDKNHVKRYEKTWVELTVVLHVGEKVHIIVYDKNEQKRVQGILQGEGVNLSQIDFFTFPTDDVWVRDNGPIFVFDKDNKLQITNWVFKGYGQKVEVYFDNYIPLRVGAALDIPITDVSMVNEGGSVEVDGCGTLMAKKSSVLNKNRNRGWKQVDAEAYFRRYLGVTNFIWLDGQQGGDQDITDDHIDGTARFANGDTIVTLEKYDFIMRKEHTVLRNAVNTKGHNYKLVHLPLTEKEVKGAYDFGFYTNYYVGNEVVVVPAFDDPNDLVAAQKIQELYPTRQVVSINCVEIYIDGGMLNCITQQQPAALKK